MATYDKFILPFLFFGAGMWLSRCPMEMIAYIVMGFILVCMYYYFYKMACDYDPFSDELNNDDLDNDNDNDLDDPDFINDNESEPESDSEEEEIVDDTKNEQNNA